MSSIRRLPIEIETALLAYAEEGRRSWRAGDLAAAEASFLAAWRCIPEPQIDHDYAQSMARGLVEFFRETHQIERAREWLGVLRASYKDPNNPSVTFLDATVEFAAGNENIAFRSFEELHRAYGVRCFRGENPAYLKFFRGYSKR